MPCPYWKCCDDIQAPSSLSVSKSISSHRWSEEQKEREKSQVKLQVILRRQVHAWIRVLLSFTFFTVAYSRSDGGLVVLCMSETCSKRASVFISTLMTFDVNNTKTTSAEIQMMLKHESESLSILLVEHGKDRISYLVSTCPVWVVDSVHPHVRPIPFGKCEWSRHVHRHLVSKQSRSSHHWIQGVAYRHFSRNLLCNPWPHAMLDRRFRRRHHSNREESFEEVHCLSIGIVQLVSIHARFQCRSGGRIHRSISNRVHRTLNHPERCIDPTKDSQARRRSASIRLTSFAMPFSQIASYLAPLA